MCEMRLYFISHVHSIKYTDLRNTCLYHRPSGGGGFCVMVYHRPQWDGGFCELWFIIGHQGAGDYTLWFYKDDRDLYNIQAYVIKVNLILYIII